VVYQHHRLQVAQVEDQEDRLLLLRSKVECRKDLQVIVQLQDQIDREVEWVM
jgi:hypothetical protein